MSLSCFQNMPIYFPSLGEIKTLNSFLLEYCYKIVFWHKLLCATKDSYLRYGCEVWGQNKNNSTNEIPRLQDKALRIISFKDRNTAARPFYNEKRIIRFFYLVAFYNCLFLAGHLNQNLPSSFGEYFTYMANRHNHNTRGAVRKLVDVPVCKTTFYGTQSITV